MLIFNRTQANPGYYNLEDFQRIKQYIDILSGRLDYVPVWNGFNDRDRVPNTTALQEMLTDVEGIRSRYYLLSSTPQTPTVTSFSTAQAWRSANAVERILYNKNNLINSTDYLVRYSGTFRAGEIDIL